MASITSDQIRAARALLRLSVIDLSEGSGVSVATIKRIEAASGVPPAHARTLDQLEKAFADLGIEFIGSPDDRPGVCLNK